LADSEWRSGPRGISRSYHWAGAADLKRLQRELFRRGPAPLDEAAVLLCLWNGQRTVDRGYQLIGYGDGEGWVVHSPDEHGPKALVPLLNL